MCLCLAIAGLATVVGAEPRTLDPAQMRGLAIAALEQGHAEDALALSEALLAREPDDVTALLVQTRALRDLGRLEEAGHSVRRAWAEADTEAQRFAAATARAQVLASGGNRTAAQVWLRRAAHIAPSDVHRARAEQDYAYVRHRNRLGVHLNFGVAPVSNINNGSKSDTGTFELPVYGVLDMTLSGAAQALSGTEFEAGTALRYRLSDGPDRRRRTDVQLDLNHRDYRLSDEARDLAPDAEGSDFAFTTAQAALVRTGLNSVPEMPFQLSAATGKTWYGGDSYTRYLDLGAVQQVKLPGGKTALSFKSGVRRQDALSAQTTDSESWRLGFGVSHVLSQGHRLSVDLTVNRSHSEAASLDYGGRSVEARLSLAEPVMGVGLEFGIGLGQRHYDQGPVSGEDRLDRDSSARVTAVFEQLDYYGFVPTVTLEARRTESDYGQYDSDEIGIWLGLRSAF